MHNDSYTMGTQKNNISENERLLSALAGAVLVPTGLSLKKRSGNDRWWISDYPYGNLNVNTQNDGMPEDQDNEPQGKSIDEATDRSKLSQL